MFTFIGLINNFYLCRKYEVFYYFNKLMVIYTYFLKFILLILGINGILLLKCKPLHIFLSINKYIWQVHFTFHVMICISSYILYSYSTALYVSSFNIHCERFTHDFLWIIGNWLSDMKDGSKLSHNNWFIYLIYVFALYIWFIYLIYVLV